MIQYVIDNLYIGSYNDIINDDINNYSIFINFSEIKCLDIIKNKCINNIEYYQYDIPDWPDKIISKYFRKCNTIITNANIKKLNVLVFCYMGKSRSVSICIGFLIRKRRFDYNKAFNYMSSIRTIEPNEGFVNQMIDYSNKKFLVKFL